MIPRTEMHKARLAVLRRLPPGQSLTLPALVDALDGRPQEDAVRVAFWGLVGDGRIVLDKRFSASRA